MVEFILGFYLTAKHSFSVNSINLDVQVIVSVEKFFLPIRLYCSCISTLFKCQLVSPLPTVQYLVI